MEVNHKVNQFTVVFSKALWVHNHIVVYTSAVPHQQTQFPSSTNQVLALMLMYGSPQSGLEH